MSQTAPVSLGIINMSVTIGGVSPTRKRNRQAFSYVFNQHSLHLFNFKDKEKLEAIAEGDAGEFGITLRGVNPYKYHNWLAFMVGEQEQFASAPSSELSADDRNSWANPGSIKYEDSLDKQISFYSSDGSYIFNSVNSAQVEHFLFIPDGSLFRAGLNNDADALSEAEKFADEGDTKERMYSFFRKFVPYHREAIIPGSHIGSGSIQYSCQAANESQSQLRTKVDSNIPPDTRMNLPPISAPETCPIDEINQDEEKKCPENSGMRNITVNNVFIDSVVEQDPRGWAEVRSSYIHPAVKGNRFGRPLAEKCNLIRNYVHPGIHSKYRKYSPIFRGMDFEIAFKSMAKEAAVAKAQAIDNDKSTMLWSLRDHYDIIDAARSPDFSDIYVGQFQNMASNNAVCSFSKDKQKRLIVASGSSNYYLADQPYVVIEIDGGKENRYFLIIPERGNVIFCEGTSDPEIIDYIDESLQGISQTEKIVQQNVYHSRILLDFGFSGKQLLSKDSFVVRFQHVGGKLGISFGNEGSIYVISRTRWSNSEIATGEVLSQSAINAPQCLPFSEWMDRYPNASNDSAVIMLEGNVNICFGNKKMAFIFSPIEYPESATLSPELPSGVLGLENYSPAVNVLLRSKGGPERPSSQQQKTGVGGIIENEDGPIVFSSPLTPLATRNISHSYLQQINGEDNIFYYTDLPFDFRAVIPADSAYAKSSSQSLLGTNWFQLTEQCEIKTSFTISNPLDLANHVMPMVMLKAGSVSLFSVDSEKAKVSQPLILSNCIRPILKDFELFIAEGGSASPMFQCDAVDVVGQVLRYQEQMIEQNKETIKHTASLDLFLSFDSASRVLELINRVRINDLPSNGNSPSPRNNRSSSSELVAGTSLGTKIATDDFLASLQDKYFYLRVRAHRSPDTINSGTDYAGWFWGTKDNEPPDGINNVLFTGICVKTAFTVEAKGVRMSCTLSDYSEMLEHSLWIQPTFYDAMRDYNAVLDVLAQAGFYAGERDPMYDPASLVKRLAQSTSKEEYYTIEYDGEEILVNDYVLPGSYDMINSPRFKASKFEPYSNILSKMAKVSGKIMYFDRLGVMHFDVPEDELENMQKVNAGSGRSELYEAPIYDKFSITMKPKNNPARSNASSPASVGNTPGPSVSIDTYNVSEVDDVNWWNVVTGVSYSFSRNTSEIKNEIRIYSTSPDMSIKTASHLNKASMYDPTSPGFIGYRKMFVQKSGFFGSSEAVKKIASRYTTMMNPPVEASFSVPGRIGLRPLQTVILDGVGPGAFKLLLREVSNEIDPKTNTWFSQVRGRYLMPAEKIEFRKPNTYEIGV